MIDLSNFYTAPISKDIAGGAPQGGALSDQRGLGVFDLLLSQLEEQIANGDAADNLASENDDNTAKLELLRALASNEAVADNVEQIDDIAELDLIAEIEQTLALNQRIFDNQFKAKLGNKDFTIDKETGEITAPDLSKSLNILADEKQDIRNNIDDLLNGLDLNTLNLTPSQLSILDDIQNNIVPTEAQADDVLSIINVLQSSFVTLSDPNSQLTISRKLQTPFSQGPQSGVGTLPFTSVDDAALDGETNFEQILNQLNGKKASNTQGLVTDLDTPSSTQQTNTPSQPAFNILQAWPFAGAGSLYGTSSFSDQIAEQLGLSLNNGQAASQGSLSALVSQAQSASQPHPATQMVAASIVKGGQGGTDTNISLRLDPPGLGRVEVQMTFTKEKNMKALITAEKPETFLMLQRDAQVLERALQDAGLDTDSGLSFELAEDGSFFDQNNQRGGGHENGGTGSGDNDEDLELIESTMTWHVDPETGHTRYDIYV